MFSGRIWEWVIVGRSGWAGRHLPGGWFQFWYRPRWVLHLGITEYVVLILFFMSVLLLLSRLFGLWSCYWITEWMNEFGDAHWAHWRPQRSAVERLPRYVRYGLGNVRMLSKPDDGREWEHNAVASDTQNSRCPSRTARCLRLAVFINTSLVALCPEATHVERLLHWRVLGHLQCPIVWRNGISVSHAVQQFGGHYWCWWR